VSAVLPNDRLCTFVTVADGTLMARREDTLGMICRLIRWFLLGAGRPVSRERAVELAHAECVRRRLPWIEPVRVHLHYGDWAVWTFADHRGGNVRVVIDAGTGAVRSVLGTTPR
jgi:hypothetical protein